jgi:hypothetical protein
MKVACITWRERDGLHRSYVIGAQAESMLAMIEEDATMTLVSVQTWGAE